MQRYNCVLSEDEYDDLVCYNNIISHPTNQVQKGKNTNEREKGINKSKKKSIFLELNGLGILKKFLSDSSLEKKILILLSYQKL